MQATVTAAEKRLYIENIRKHPEVYLRRRFDIPYWHDGMTKMIRAVQRAIVEHKPVVVGSGHAQSKDYLFGRMPLWFLEAYGPCICLMTAPTDRQVKQVCWAELATAYNTRKDKNDGLIEPLKTIMEIREDWKIVPFSTKDSKEAVGKFQGFHSPRMMTIFSEAQAIPDEVFDQAESCMAGEIGVLVLLGNPLRATGRFAKMLKDPRNNIIVNLNVLESPNYLEKKIVVPGMATYEWVENKRRRWGTEDPRWYGRVLGLVPPTGTNSCFPDAWYEAAQKRRIHAAEDIIVVSCDVATSGEDDAQIYGTKNGAIVYEKTISGSTDLRIVAQECFVAVQEIGANILVYDGNGVGDGLGVVYCMLDQRAKIWDPLTPGNVQIPVRVVASKGSHGARNSRQYLNARAEDHFVAREAMKTGKVQMPPDDDNGPNDELRNELTSIEFFVNDKGLIQIEDKEDLKERLEHSPNKAEAWILNVKGMNLTVPIQKQERRLEQHRRRRMFAFGEEEATQGDAYGDWGDQL